MNKFVDISRYQPDDLGFFTSLKNAGIKSAMVQLTYGNYPRFDNPKASYQVYNAWKTFGIVGAYHYFMGKPETEAKYFLKHVKANKLDKTTMLTIDVEDSSLSGDIQSQVNKFLDVIYASGYHNLSVYANQYFFNAKLNVKKLHHNPAIWIASYGAKPTQTYDAWQYTQSGYIGGSAVDISIDRTSWFTRVHDNKPKAEYYKDGSLFEMLGDRNVYNSLHLVDSQKRRDLLTKGSRIYAKPVKNGNIYTLKSKIGYISANKKLVKKIEY